MNRLLGLLLTVICAGLLDQTAGQCLVGYTDPVNDKISSSCYRFVTAAKLGWIDASQICQHDGGDLAVISSEDELNFIMAKLPVNDSRVYYHVGLRIVDTVSNAWVWVDGTSYDTNLVKFNNPTSSFDYAALRMDRKFQKLRNTDPNFYICERSKYTTVKCDASQGWKEAADGSCIKFVDMGRTSFWSARTLCQKDSGDLVTIKSDQVNTLVTSNIAKGTFTWIGLTTALNEDLYLDGNATWQWITGENLTYNNWGASPAIPPASRKNACGELDSTGKWTPINCNWTGGIAGSTKITCQRNGGDCPDGWTRSGTFCYLYGYKKTWPEANHDCTSRGANLVLFTSAEVQTFIQAALPDFLANGQSNIWIGYKQDSSYGSFSPVVSTPTTTNWAPGFPKNGTIPYGCGRIGTASADGKWTSSTCADLNGYVCQAPAGRTLKPPTTNPPKPKYYCESGWLQWNEECYLVLNEEAKFEAAREMCGTYGSSLALVDGIEYQAMVTRLTASSNVAQYWIGLRKVAAGEYRWVATEKLADNFQNFVDGADPSNDKNNCIMMYGGSMENAGRWDFRSCDLALPVICSKDPSLSSPIPTPPASVPSTSTIRCPSGWEDDGSTDYCYFYMSYTATWTNALHGCRNLGAELAYVMSIDQMRIIANRIKNRGAGWWLGMNKRGSESQRYRWSLDTLPVTFTNWDNGEPVDANGDCVLSLSASGSWQFRQCDQKYNFICQRVAYNLRPTRPPVIYTTPIGGSLTCKEGWLQNPLNNNCYRVYADRATWYDASTYCKSAATQGNLVSISDVYEEDFVKLMATETALSSSARNLTVLWLGLYDKLDNTYPRMVEYAWSDGSKVSYTSWMPKEPSSSDQECVAMSLPRAGQWYDMDCKTYLVDGFICEAPPVVSTAPKTTAQPSGCQPPFTLAYEGKCFLINPQDSLSWDKSRSVCRGFNGDLAVLSTRQEQNYIAVALASHDVLVSPYWIGLSGTNDNWMWVDGSTPTFTNWVNYTEPQLRTCIAITDESSTSPGLWTLQDCGNSLPYICSKERQGWTRTQSTRTTSVGATVCPNGWITSNYRCYLPVNITLSVSDAISFCEKNFYSRLASFTTVTEQNGVANFMEYRFGVRDAWIGLSKQSAERGWQWMDGSPVLYEKWGANEPDNADDAKTCAFMMLQRRTNDSYWVSDDCSDDQRHFICMRHKGVAMTTSTARPSDENATALCGGVGWQLFDSSCYWFETSYQTTWNKALEQCYTINASLVSIQNLQENNYVQKSIGSSMLKYIWTGLNELTYTGFNWADGSPLSYTNWDSNPHAINGPCIAMTVSSGKWLNQHCESPYSFVCKKPIDGVVERPTAPPPNTGGCPVDYISYSRSAKCFKIVTDVATTQADAISRCQQSILGRAGNLASFNDVIDLNFVLSKLRNVSALSQAAYIGLFDYSRVRGQPEFRWLDNTPLYYTNWDFNEPDILPTTPAGSCVDMYLSGSAVGNWRAQKNCNNMQTFICSLAKSPSLPPQPDVGTNLCEPNWVSYNEHCYFVDGRTSDTALSWDAARDACLKLKADLVSIHDPYEQAAITWSTMLGDNFNTPISFWIGLNTYNAPDVWQWTDTWPVDYTGWLPTEPSESTTKRCAAGVIRSPWAAQAGFWASEDCRKKNAYVCRKTTALNDNVHDAYVDGSCPRGWLNGISKCYHVATTARLKWDDLLVTCKSLNGTFGPLETLADNQMVATEIARQKNVYGDSATNVWLALSTHGGVLSAPDGTVLSYTNWADGVQPSSTQQSVYMTQTSFWYLTDPKTLYGYVCKQSKTPRATRPPVDWTATSDQMIVITKGPPMYSHEDSYDSGAGIIAGVCIAFVVVLIGLVGLMIYLKRKNMVPAKVDEMMSKSSTLRGNAPPASAGSSSGTSSGLVGFENVVFEAPKDSATVPKSSSNEKSEDLAAV